MCTHEAVPTVEEGLKAIEFTGAFEGAKFAKNLFLHDKKKKNRLWLVVAAHDTAVDMKQLTKSLGVGSGNLRQGDAEKLEGILGVQGGSVNLFSIVNDVDNAVTLVVDQRLWNDFDYVGFHPMVNTATVAISREDMQKVVELSGHEPTIMDFGGASTGTTAAPAKPQE